MSAADGFKAKYILLRDFILQIQESVRTDVCTTNDVAYDVFSEIRRVGRMCTDLRYISDDMDWSITSENSILRDNLLCMLMDVLNHHPPAEFPLGSHNLNQLLLLILKLKLLIPDRDGLDGDTKDTFHIIRSMEEEENVEIVNDTQGRINLLSSYQTLTAIQRDCLLCFSIFPCHVLKELGIKKRTLIHWWVGEGFIDPSPNSNLGTSIDSCSTANDVNQVSQRVNVSASERPEKQPSTIKEVGNEILKVLEEKGFIEPVIKNGQESGFCRMQPSRYSFVTTRAREDGFFDFNENDKLTPCFTRSKRACLLTTKGNIPSSYSLWASHTHFPKRLKSFKAVRTLFNVNEAVIDINVEWFSRMKYLSVLHLGVWQPEMVGGIEVVDPSFLDELKNMKQLRLLNLQGVQLILKLPDSICKLIDLRGCRYLEGLPANIGALKNLIHLDITDCPLLSKLPKGIRLLSKLEVLKGFIIIHPDGGGIYRKMLILEDLLNLGKLSKLSLFVKIGGFPGSQDLLVLKRMKNLCKLNLTWEISTSAIRTTSGIRRSQDQEAPKGCVWLKRSRKADQLNPSVPRENEASTIQQQSNLRKLVLRCLPLETAPSLLDPSAWEKLEELYISGGVLRELPNDKDEWNVKTLHLKYLPRLEITWPDLRSMFPQMTYLENCWCDNLSSFPCEAEGVEINNTGDEFTGQPSQQSIDEPNPIDEDKPT